MQEPFYYGSSLLLDGTSQGVEHPLVVYFPSLPPPSMTPGGHIVHATSSLKLLANLSLCTFTEELQVFPFELSPKVVNGFIGKSLVANRSVTPVTTGTILPPVYGPLTDSVIPSDLVFTG